MKNGEIFRKFIQLVRVEKTRGGRQPKRLPTEYDKVWLPTPETCQNPGNLPSLQKRNFDNIADLQKRDHLDPPNNEQDKKTFLGQLDWSRLALNHDQVSEMQKLLAEYYEIFAQNRFDVGYKTELKVKLTPAHDLPVYVQSPLTPIHLRDEILVECTTNAILCHCHTFTRL